MRGANVRGKVSVSRGCALRLSYITTLSLSIPRSRIPSCPFPRRRPHLTTSANSTMDYERWVAQATAAAASRTADPAARGAAVARPSAARERAQMTDLRIGAADKVVNLSG